MPSQTFPASIRIEVRVSPAALASRGVALTDIADAIARTTGAAPAGRGGGDDTLGALVVSTANGAVPLRDIARISQTSARTSDEPVHVRIALQDGAEREKAIADLEAELARMRAEVPPGVTLVPYAVAAPPPARFALRGPERARLAELARGAHRHAASPADPPPTLALAIDRARAAEAGVEVSAIARTLALATGQPVGTMNTAGRERSIVIALDGPDLSACAVRSRTGLTPLSAVTTVTAATAQDDAPRDRVDRMPAVFLDDREGVPGELPAGYSLRPL